LAGITKLTRGTPIAVEESASLMVAIKIEGDFDLPTLARLSAEDQVFVMAFVRCDGSIKEMERVFGISLSHSQKPADPHCRGNFIRRKYADAGSGRCFGQLAHGEITVNDAIERLSKWVYRLAWCTYGFITRTSFRSLAALLLAFYLFSWFWLIVGLTFRLGELCCCWSAIFKHIVRTAGTQSWNRQNKWESWSIVV